jgi:hypothetical protein
MELDGLPEHVRQVAEALGRTGEPCWRTEEPPTAYLPLHEHLYGFPGRAAALMWDAEHGWSAVIDDAVPLVVAYLDTAPPEPATVAAFVADLVAGRGRSPATSPCADLVG